MINSNSVKKILLVDDEKRLLNSMGQRLTLMGFEVMKASSGTAAIEIAEKINIDLAIVDLKMPDMDGLITITRLKALIPNLKTVLLTGYGSKKIKKRTASLDTDYFEKDSMSDLWDLIKGFKSHGNVVVINPSSSDTESKPKNKYIIDHFSSTGLDILNDTYEKGGDQNDVQADTDSSNKNVDELPKLIGETPEMQKLRKNIDRLSGLDCTVLIQGETGTGKELAAKAIHMLSHRKKQRFLAFNCGCFSSDFHFNELLSSIEQPLSQSQDGKKTKGFVGTILLDHFEIMPEQTQLEMIKILDGMAATQSPDSVSAPFDIRFIIATHQDLKKKVTQEKFNKDLFNRLNAIVLLMPSLRERREDIFPLCSYFLNTLNKEFKKNITSISDDVFSVLMAYPFPGNVRELKHIIERAVILANDSTITLHHLPERFNEDLENYDQIENQQFLTITEMEDRHILKAMNFTKGNKSKAAEILGISRGALWRKLKKLDNNS